VISTAVTAPADRLRSRIGAGVDVPEFVKRHLQEQHARPARPGNRRNRIVRVEKQAVEEVRGRNGALVVPNSHREFQILDHRSLHVDASPSREIQSETKRIAAYR
jgi:hypothetical protein